MKPCRRHYLGDVGCGALLYQQHIAEVEPYWGPIDANAFGEGLIETDPALSKRVCITIGPRLVVLWTV